MAQRLMFPFPYRPQAGRFSDVLDRASKLCLIGLFLIAFTVALIQASQILLPMTFAIVIGLLLGPLSGKMERKGIPPALAAAILMTALLLLVYGVLMVLWLPLQVWLERAPELWTTLQVKLYELRATLFRLREVTDRLEEITRMSEETAQTVVLNEGGLLSSAALTAPSLLAQLALFIVTLFFYLATRTRLRIGILTLCATRRARLTAARIMRDSELRVSAYLGLITLINIGLGLVVAAAMAMIGLPTPLLWGALAGLLNYVQYLGPLLTTALLAAVGLVTYDSLGMALLPALLHFGINFIEGQVVTPAVLGQRFTINPLLILASLAFWLWVWGPIGALIAVPILIVMIVIITYLALPHMAAAEIAQERRRQFEREVRRQRRLTSAAANPMPQTAFRPPETR